MMKKPTRTIDVPKLRRNLKNRARISETIDFSGFAYLKLLLLWLTCIALDLLIGFRFELLYPVWLLIRNCYDSFRVQGLVSSIQYSAFSVFFVCATATTDLICFIFLPVQLLLLLASTYVWVLFVYHTAERGIGSTQILLWAALISFEYNWRYRGDSSLYVLRGTTIGWFINLVTGGLLSSWLGLRDSPASVAITSGVDHEIPSRNGECFEIETPGGGGGCSSGMLGGFGIALSAAFAHSSSLTSDLCRPFAAHCIGYPVVTLCFGLKSYMSLWRIKRRQRDVSRENEIYGRLLVEALPSIYEGPKQYLRTNGMLLNDAENAIDYETEICTPVSTNLAICASPSSTLSGTQRKTSARGSSSIPWKPNGVKSLGSKRGAHVNGIMSTKDQNRVIDDDYDSSGSDSGSGSTSRITLWRFVYEIIFGAITFLLSGGNTNSSALDDRISLSSNEGDSEDEMMEQDDTSSLADEIPSASGSISRCVGSSKKCKGGATRMKGCGRARGRSSHAAHSEYYSHLSPSPASNEHYYPAVSLSNNVSNLSGVSLQEKQLYNSSLPSGGSCQQNSSIGSESKSSSKYDNTEFISVEDVESLRSELRLARNHEAEARTLYQQSLSAEKQVRNELAQLKTKYDQLDSKLSNVTRAREQDRSSIQLLEKRLIEAQTKKNELEKELNIGKRNKLKEEQAAARAIAAAQSKTAECCEACRVKRTEMEREVRTLKRELKEKDNVISAYEDQIKQLQDQKGNNELQAQLTSLRDTNAHLEQLLSSENRLKQDLFRVFSESKAHSAMLQNQLRKRDMELAELRLNLVNGTSDCHKLSSNVSIGAHGLPPLVTSSSVTTSVSQSSPGSVPLMNGTNAAKNISSVSNEQNMELLTAALSNAASKAYLPYSFGAQTGGGDHLLFDATISASQPGMNAPSANSISPPPVSSAVAHSSETLRYNTNFGVPMPPKASITRTN